MLSGVMRVMYVVRLAGLLSDDSKRCFCSPKEIDVSYAVMRGGWGAGRLIQ